VELQGRLAQLRRDGIAVVAVSYDRVETLREFSDRRGITFPLLSDTGSAVIKQYGLLNTTLKPTDATFGIPFPGTLMLDAKGTVQSRFFERAYQERTTVASIMARRGAQSNAQATAVAAPHLTIKAFASDAVVAPGTHFSLVVDITPASRVHVYAPEVVGYKPLKLTVVTQPSLLVKDIQYPKAEDYFFMPLNEHVAVYQRPFRIVQDVAFDPSRASEAALKDRTSATVVAGATASAGPRAREAVRQTRFVRRATPAWQ
jgi:hypothetical protein